MRGSALEAADTTTIRENYGGAAGTGAETCILGDLR
jgi:hypothetical protein